MEGDFFQLAIGVKSEPLPVRRKDGSAEGPFRPWDGLSFQAVQCAHIKLSNSATAAQKRDVIPLRGKRHSRSLQAR